MWGLWRTAASTVRGFKRQDEGIWEEENVLAAPALSLSLALALCENHAHDVGQTEAKRRLALNLRDSATERLNDTHFDTSV